MQVGACVAVTRRACSDTRCCAPALDSMRLVQGLRVRFAHRFSGAAVGLEDRTLRTALREAVGRNEGQSIGNSFLEEVDRLYAPRHRRDFGSTGGNHSGTRSHLSKCTGSACLSHSASCWKECRAVHRVWNTPVYMETSVNPVLAQPALSGALLKVLLVLCLSW
uniref:Uncharacterized protein n=1 Tax=Molossus molossus TaxID=27622 RepID=A0A7J8BYD0_MOLMO|nr:hypothetical protein HJG59_010022 [Molossus molossus]